MAIQAALHPIHPLLLVDDEELALTSMSVALRTAGYNNLRICSDSRRVAGMLAQEEFSLVILDLNMPHVTGQEIIRASAAMEKRPPVIVVTASTHIKDYAEGAAGGVSDYLVKPIERERLISVVQRALARPASSRGGRLTRNYLLSDQINDSSRVRDPSADAGMVDMLEQTRMEYRRLIGGLPTPYLLLDEGTFRIRYRNDAFTRFLGVESLAAAEKANFFDLLDPECREAAVSALREYGELRDRELKGRTPDGRSFVIVGTFRLSSNDGLVEGGFVDVTASKQLEQELARAHRLEMVGRLAAGLAHDFNNTLLVVTGFAEMIASEDRVSQSIREYAAEICQASAKASKMVRELFSMGRPPAKAHGCIDVNGILCEAETSLRQHLRPGQSLVLALEPNNPLVDIPSLQLDQVVRNLVLNARDAMPEGGTITIRTRTERDRSVPGAPEKVLLEIRDTGTGMDDATIARIFEPFFTTKSEKEGTGLGLPMVQMIIEAAGGHIHVESSPGSGTLFRITLPSAADNSQGRPSLPQSLQEVRT